MGSRYSARELQSFALAVASLAASSACNVFDDKLEARLDENMDAGDIGPGDAGGDASPPSTDAGDDAAMTPPAAFMLADTCSTTIPEVQSSETSMTIAVAGLVSSVAESGECSVSPDVLSKADGFFQVKARAGQRWHFHLDPAPNENLAVFTSASCDLRECVAAADVCGVNESEHFTFVAEHAGDYVVVLDGIDPNGGQLHLLAISPECGDGKKVHGEVCDDGNQQKGDGCDAACRVELNGAAVEEVEPNDDTYLANVITSDLSAPVAINGKIGGNACQPDNFLIRVPTAGELAIKVRGGAGGACSNAPLMDLALTSADQFELRDNVVIGHQPSSNGGCPELTETVGPGTYYVRLSRLAAAAQFEYQIQLSLTTPVAEP